jgi:hypothetical protein
VIESSEFRAIELIVEAPGYRGYRRPPSRIEQMERQRAQLPAPRCHS